MAEAHFRRARVELTRHAATVAGIGHEQHARATQFELLDEMVEFLAEDALLRAGGGGLEIRQQKDVLHAVGLGAFHALRLLRAVTGDREHDQILRPRARHQPVKLAHDRGAVGLAVDQRGHVAGAHAAQRALDIAGVGDRALERPIVAIGIDADDQCSHGAAIRRAQDE